MDPSRTESTLAAVSRHGEVVLVLSATVSSRPRAGLMLSHLASRIYPFGSPGEARRAPSLHLPSWAAKSWCSTAQAAAGPLRRPPTGVLDCDRELDFLGAHTHSSSSAPASCAESRLSWLYFAHPAQLEPRAPGGSPPRCRRPRPSRSLSLCSTARPVSLGAELETRCSGAASSPARRSRRAACWSPPR